MKRILLIFAAICCMSGICAQSIGDILPQLTPGINMIRVQDIMGVPTVRIVFNETEKHIYRLKDENNQKQKYFFIYRDFSLKQVTRHDKESKSDVIVWDADSVARWAVSDPSLPIHEDTTGLVPPAEKADPDVYSRLKQSVK